MTSLVPEPSVSRVIEREMFVLLGGTAALLMQVAHPLVAAGVEQHSDFRTDPIGRLHRTLDTTFAVVFGDDAAARQALARIDRRHGEVRGTSATGRAYSARDPSLLLWVQCTLVLTSLRWYQAVAGPLSPAARESYWQEAKPISVALGIPEPSLPGSLAELEAYERRMLGSEVVPDATSVAVGRAVLRPFAWLPEAAYLPNDVLAAGLLPPVLRAPFGLRYGLVERLLFRSATVSLGGLRRLLPDLLTVVPPARRFEAALKVRA